MQGHLSVICSWSSWTQWLEVIPIPTIISTATIQSLRNTFSHFGPPEQVLTDNGPSFVSAEFRNFLKQNGIKHTTLPPYHPASNGLVEKAVQIFKRGLRKMKEGNLHTKLARSLFNYRITPQSTTGTSPAELLQGQTLR